MLTVQCSDSVLITWPAASENFDNQMAALEHALEEDGLSEPKLLFSDSPEVLDKEELFNKLTRLLCCAMDYMHPALKIETASGEKITPLSLKLRRCLKKFQIGSEDGRPYFKTGMKPMAAKTLDEAIATMTHKIADNRLKAIDSDNYHMESYRNALDFQKDVAALCIAFASEMPKRTSKKTTIKDSLRYATRPVALEYLMNGSRFAARQPDIDLMAGTTRNEAYHLQLKFMFRNVMHQTGRNAKIVAGVATLIKLLGGYIQKECDFTIIHHEHSLLNQVASSLMAIPMSFRPLMNHRRVDNPKVDVSSLPKNAKRMAKRRASSATTLIMKRPASFVTAPIKKRPRAA